MDRIIVTIKADHYKQDYDMELPLDQKADGLIYDIAVSMEGVDPSLWFDPENVNLEMREPGGGSTGKRLWKREESGTETS